MIFVVELYVVAVCGCMLRILSVVTLVVMVFGMSL